MEKIPRVIADEAHRRFLVAFKELYAVNGMKGLSAAALSAKTGYSRSTFYRYFESVYDLLVLVEVEATPYENMAYLVRHANEVDMNDITLGEIEAKFADLIWENEPVASGELVKLAEAALGWKKSTTYTVLRRLCEKGLFRNEGGEVRAAVSREEFNGRRSEQFVNETFGGSLPRFLTAFSRGKKLSEDEVAALLKFIEENRQGG